MKQIISVLPNFKNRKCMVIHCYYCIVRPQKNRGSMLELRSGKDPP